jgi:hypothetical protein
MIRPDRIHEGQLVSSLKKIRPGRDVAQIDTIENHLPVNAHTADAGG